MQNNKNFDSQLQAYFSAIKHSIKQQHISYLKQHPELRQILNDFLSSCLLEQPQNVYQYARNFFSYFNYQKDTVKYKPLVLSGCSGAGKGTIVKRLLSMHPNIFELSISYTTRNAREGEVHGREYFFVKNQDFQKQIKKNIFVQYCKMHQYYYGTHKGKLNDIVNRGKIAILQIDLQGGQRIKENSYDCNYIFIDVPSMQVLKERLKAMEDEDFVDQRMKNVSEELQEVNKLSYYKRFMNDNLEECINEIKKYVTEIYSMKFE